MKKEARLFINECILLENRTYWFCLFIKHLAIFCQKTIQNLNLTEIKDFDIMNISAEIEDGIFCYKKKKKILENEKETKLEYKLSIIELFLEDIKDGIDYDTIINVFPNCEKEDIEELLNDFDKLFIFYPTILLMLKR